MGVLSCIEISLGLDHIVPTVPGALFDSAIFSPSIEEGAGFLVSLRWAVVPVLEVSWQADRKTRRKKKPLSSNDGYAKRQLCILDIILYDWDGVGWADGRMGGKKTAYFCFSLSFAFFL